MVAQQEKALAAKPDDLRSVPRTHPAEREPISEGYSLTPTQMP